MRDSLGGNVRTHLLRAAVISSAYIACHTSVEQQLAWADKADPALMLAASIRAGQFQFLAVCWYSCTTPAVGVVTYSQCYRTIAKVHTVDPTGDVIQSAEHERLKNKAEHVAEDYNTRMMAWLDSTGKRTCPAGERWDELWRAMIAFGDSEPLHRFGVTANGEPSKGSDFHLHFGSLADLTTEVKGHLCSLPPLFGISRPVQFKVTTGDINHNPTEHPGLTCAQGKVAA
jgi:hypothetical protein